MTMISPLDRPAPATCLIMPGLAADNLLASMALFGLLRALDHERPDWHARARWSGPPWTAELLLDAEVSEGDVAAAADSGINRIAAQYGMVPEGSNQAPPRDVKFTAGEFRDIVAARRHDPVGAALVSVLSAEMPVRDNGTVMPAPLVLLFGQGHQHFLDRLTSVPLQPVPVGKGKVRQSLPAAADKISEALFAPWSRADETDGFRWDPADDQRYALRFGDPSKAGAARTMHGANRLAALGLLSFPCVAGERSLAAVGSIQADGTRHYIWPVWTQALTLAGIETLLARDLAALPIPAREAYGIACVMRARRIPNGKFMNVTPAVEA
ncbi:MAG: hypothetical protein AB7F35_15300 [Acetobacteraceae bacterium]